MNPAVFWLKNYIIYALILKYETNRNSREETWESTQMQKKGCICKYRVTKCHSWKYERKHWKLQQCFLYMPLLNWVFQTSETPIISLWLYEIYKYWNTKGSKDMQFYHCIRSSHGIVDLIDHLDGHLTITGLHINQSTSEKCFFKHK